MSIYSDFNTISFQGNCPICMDALEDNAVAHEGNGRLHPLHRECAKTAALTSSRCPSGCGTDIDPNTLFTWIERCVNELKPIVQDAYVGGAVSLIAAPYCIRSKYYLLPISIFIAAKALYDAAANGVLEGSITGIRDAGEIVGLTGILVSSICATLRDDTGSSFKKIYSWSLGSCIGILTTNVSQRFAFQIVTSTIGTSPVANVIGQIAKTVIGTGLGGIAGSVVAGFLARKLPSFI